MRGLQSIRLPNVVDGRGSRLSPGLATRLAGTAIYARRVLEQRRAPFLPEEQVRARADARARTIAAYAARWVPYCRGLFDPREIRGVADLAELPLLDKAMVRATPDAFRSRAPDATGGLSLRTTARPGIPLTVDHDRRSLLENIAFAERIVETHFIGRRFGYDALDLGFRQTITTPQEIRAYYDRPCYRPLRLDTTASKLASTPRAVGGGRAVRTVADALPEPVNSWPHGPAGRSSQQARSPKWRGRSRPRRR